MSEAVSGQLDRLGRAAVDQNEFFSISIDGTMIHV